MRVPLLSAAEAVDHGWLVPSVDSAVQFARLFFLKRKAVCLTLYSRLKIEDARTGAGEGTTPLTSHLEVLLLLVISSSLLSDGLVGRWYYFKSAKHQ
jgi:hypothetical protein